MRLQNWTKPTSALALAMFAGACDEGLTEINVNPNGPTEVAAEYVFPQGVTAAVGLVRGAGFDMTFTSLWAQHYAKIQYTEEDRYDIRSESNEGWWRAFYAGPLQDFADVVRNAEERNRPNLAAPALVMKTWTFGAMTDVWGDLPYSEANKGTDPSASLTPKYDRQADIYNGFFTELKLAADMLDPAGLTYAAADPIYNGDVAKWEKFANSLRLRYAMRIVNVDPGKAQAEFTAALADGVFTSNADNAVLAWPGDKINDAPIAENFKSRDDHRVSKTLVDRLKELSDPRLAVYADPAVDTNEYVGARNGLLSPDAVAQGLTQTSKIGIYFAKPNASSVLMSYAEVLFLQAEAAARGWTSGDAAELYRQAITASMKVYGISDEAISSYLSQPAVQYDGLNSIWEQKWIALYGQGSEAYAHVRRTGVPALQPGPAAIVPTLPLRLPYPATEQSFNKASLDAAKAAQGGDDLTTPLWWIAQ